MLPVKPGARHCRNEKLGCVRVGAAVGHAEDKRNIVFEARVELIRELLAPNGLAARAVAFRAARLNHEAFDYPVEDQVVVVPIFGVGHEILNCFGTLVWKQLTVNLALARVDDDLVWQTIFLGYFL